MQYGDKHRITIHCITFKQNHGCFLWKLFSLSK